ncbi:MAG: dihydrolipoyl dehydrogenase [Omnitrophica bacterium RIFCSPHIGHO2_02_FULL_51_18]|nr:MAG: dihydrolipoyl dehydrogenase [Omnitrophica bacterium RIFCSPHIGHO2_02_FULL_51_18]
MNASFDLIVLGGGPGGYVAALRAGQLGLKTCLVEKDFLGGVCLNKGCIPSKTLLSGTELFTKIQKAGEWGIELDSPPRWNLKKLFDRKEEVVRKMRQGLESLCQKRNVFVARGLGRMEGPTTIKVGNDRYEAKSLVIATGSAPKRVDFGGGLSDAVLSSEEALSLSDQPESLLVIGGGAEGCEFSLIFRGLGSAVTLVEMEERLLPGFDRDASAAIKRSLTAKGIEVLTQDTVTAVKRQDKKLKVQFKSGLSKEVDKILVCAGRKPNTKDIGFEACGVKLDDNGFILTDRHLRTSLSHAYAVGDVTGRRMMAHSASYEGYVTAGRIAGYKEILDYTAVPSCVYTYPEVAQVGLSEEKARAEEVPFEVGRFSFMALGRAHAKGEAEGFVKIIGHAKTGRVLGGVIVGQGASELINVVGLAIRKKLKVEDLRSHIAPHPSASEALVEAAHLFFKEGLHFA